MIFPQMWSLKRPGILIPVFFLSLFPVSAQISWQEAVVASLGGTCVTRPGFCNSGHNQAGLGWIDRSSIAVEHARPFLIRDLDISSLSTQHRVGEGALGTMLSSFGITGLKYTSAWISYGLKLHPKLAAGLGLHFWNTSIREQFLYHPGFSCAMGIQVRINEQLMIGGHVLHPIGWYSNIPVQRNQQMVISAGCSYTLFQTITYYADLHFKNENQIQMCHGVELKMNERFGLMLGMHDQPFSVSAGLMLAHSNWILHAAFEFMIDSGGIPYSSLAYAW